MVANNNKIKHKVTESIDDTSNAIKKGAHKGKEKVEDLTDYAEKQAYYIGEKARDTIDQVENYAKTYAYEVEAQAKAHPFIAIGASFLMGLLLGKLLSNNK